jgi:putative transposon-encoded protein
MGPFCVFALVIIIAVILLVLKSGTTMKAFKKPNNFNKIVSRMDKNPLPNVKFEVFGEEMIEKEVKQSGNNGRVYLPPDWIGKQVQIIRIN